VSSKPTAQLAAPALLADYTEPALLLPALRERDTAGIISELSQVLQHDGCVPDVLPFYQAALNQESLANSALESGLAFPHARMSGVKQLRFALGRVPEPVIWGGKSSWPVRLIFLLAVPATDAAGYLHLLATLARLGQQAEILRRLCNADDAEAIFELLQQIRLKPS
jgi:fructose PTS system EIIBC or EIIC component